MGTVDNGGVAVSVFPTGVHELMIPPMRPSTIQILKRRLENDLIDCMCMNMEKFIRSMTFQRFLAAGFSGPARIAMAINPTSVARRAGKKFIVP
jgi:hypothetical protein